MHEDDAALFTDLYQLTMLQAYALEEMEEEAVFDLFVRRLRQRNYLLACGLEDALRYLETLRFSPSALEYLETTGLFRPAFLEYLAAFRFTGDVYAMPEGTPVFAGEPLLVVVAPIGQAQLVETYLLNQITFQTGAASKASRVVTAAAGRLVADFGMRRMHGTDAALKAARAFHIAGVDSTSNVLAGQRYGLPITGTQAHSYIEAHASELDAFRAFASIYPGTTLLVDTYDTVEGVRRLVELSRSEGEAFRIGAVRLDSGDLGALARETRRLLDEAGLASVRIFASGSLDEHAITELVEAGAPIDGFGVGTRLGTIADVPYLDSVYKLSEYAGEPRMKLSSRKSSLPGRKQVYRRYEDGQAVEDVIATAGERCEGEPLLRCVMHGGRRTEDGRGSLDAARERARSALTTLPPRLLRLEQADPPYPVRLTSTLEALRDRTRATIARQG